MPALTGRSRLCAKCQAIVLPAHLYDTSWLHIIRLADISESRSSCSLCMIAHRAFGSIATRGSEGCSSSIVIELVERLDEAKGQSKKNRPKLLNLIDYDQYFLRLSNSVDAPRAMLAERELQAEETQTSQNVTYKLLDENSKSVFSQWKGAEKEVLECEKNHSCFTAEDVELPTRLVNLSNYTNNLITIMTTAELEKGNSYAALSYCWGRSNTFTTTSATLADRQQGFSPSELPRSLQDALRVAHDLSIRYIWIDALCIIQGSEEDWLHESARMASIYKNAFITIVAANAPDASHGFFSMAEHPCQLPVEPSHEGHQTAFVTVDTAVPFKDEPINRRAWTLQEWELAPRRLVFTSSGIHYICPQYMLDKGKNKPFGAMYAPHLEANSNWGGLVQNYTSRSLTNPQDKLSAIEGMAQTFFLLTKVENGRYLAGLWEKQLEKSLLWRQGGIANAFFPESHNSRPDDWIAPSWSWASIQGFVDFTLGTSGTSLVEIIGAETTLASPDNPYGRVVSGSLTISGPCMAIEVVDGAKFSQRREPDGSRWFKLTGKKVGYLYLDADSNIQKQHEALENQEALCFLGLRTSPHERKGSEIICGLVLVERSPAVFSRIGAFLKSTKSPWFERAERRELTIV